MLDLFIRGGKVVLPAGVQEVGLGIAAGKVKGIFAPGEEPQAKEVRDINGCFVLPGLIEPHSHFGIYNPLEKDFELDSQFGALGGFTTVFNFFRKPGSYLKQLPEAIQVGEKYSLIDFAFHLGILLEDQMNELPQYLQQLGVTSYKFYMGYKGMEKERFGSERVIDDGFLFEIMQVMRQTSEKCVLCIHAENIEVSRYYQKKLASDPQDTLAYFESLSPDFTETEAIIRTSYLASQVGVKVYFVHTSAGSSVETIKRLPWFDRSSHFVETGVHYLCETVDCPAGLRAVVKPPIRYEKDSQLLWQALEAGWVDTLGSDEAPNYLERKFAKGPDVSGTELGFSEMGFTLPLLFEEGYHRRGLPLEKIAQVTSTNVARIFGLYPRKGVITVGSDADLVVVDPELRRTINPDTFIQASDYTIFNGRSPRGWPVLTISRGQVIAEDGKIVAPAGRGCYLRRQ